MDLAVNVGGSSSGKAHGHSGTDSMSSSSEINNMFFAVGYKAKYY